MKTRKFRVHLRHIGTGPRRRPGYTRGNFRGDSYFWNIYLGGCYFIAIRPLTPGRDTYPGFFNLEMGRAMLRYRREEEACPWPGTDHYYGICECPNKGATHPRYVPWVWFCIPNGDIGKAFPESEQDHLWVSAEELTDVIYFVATEEEVLR